MRGVKICCGSIHLGLTLRRWGKGTAQFQLGLQLSPQAAQIDRHFFGKLITLVAIFSE